MRILTVGGGSGGHVTPVLAVIKEIKSKEPGSEIRLWTDSGFFERTRKLAGESGLEIQVQKISSGKFRRYTGLSAWQHLSQVRSILIPNLVDGFKFIYGTLQSIVKLGSWKPDVIFAKGGYVCLPVGLAAKFWNIPLVIHESDTHAGLTSRVLSKWAVKIATGAPSNLYSFPRNKSIFTGIPLRSAFTEAAEKEARNLKSELGLDAGKPLLVVVGGGLGAANINDIIWSGKDVLSGFTQVVLVAGESWLAVNEISTTDSQAFRVFSFLGDDLISYLKAADLVISRAGMTALSELSALRKPVIVIPNEYLTGGHQTKNAQMFLEANAVCLVREGDFMDEPKFLFDKIHELLSSKELRRDLSENIKKFSNPDAAEILSKVILDSSSVKGL